jgi:2-oxo-4-hydroxy-4-carboxy-5-ureidoimidazoline decarboxylase
VGSTGDAIRIHFSEARLIENVEDRIIVTLSTLNALDEPRFVDAVGWIFEHSPWVAKRTWKYRPFASREALHRIMVKQVEEASPEEQITLLRAHPDLGTRARLSAASSVEQARAGLDQLTPEEVDKLQTLNDRYRDKFGWPFLFAVKGSAKQDILRALEQRLPASLECEYQISLEQVFRIAAFRLQDVITEEE